jgi:hypothetical protein
MWTYVYMVSVTVYLYLSQKPKQMKICFHCVVAVSVASLDSHLCYNSPSGRVPGCPLTVWLLAAAAAGWGLGARRPVCSGVYFLLYTVLRYEWI